MQCAAISTLALAQQEEAAKREEARAFLDEQLREVRRIEGLVARKSLPQNQLDERRTLRAGEPDDGVDV